MKKFQFKLKALLSYREHIENMAKEEVAKVQMEINKCVQSLHEFETLYNSGTLKFESRMLEGISSEDHRSYTDYFRGLKIKITSEKELLEKLGMILRKKKEELAKKSVSRKVIEQLKEKRKAEYYDEADKLAIKEADEMVLISRSFKEKSSVS